MPIPPEVVKCYKYIDSNVENYIKELAEFVKIQNVCYDRDFKDETRRAIKWMQSKLKHLGFTIILRRPVGEDYKNKHVPPVIIAYYEDNKPSKKTLLYYCHLDVLKVNRTQWETPPFELTEKNGKYHGRGTAKLKGPILSFIHAIEAYRNLDIEIPVNLKIVCESMGEFRSMGLERVLGEVRTGFLSDVDCVMVTTSNWLGKDYPCIVYGMRGVSYFNMTIEGPKTDLNSGEYGGLVREPMQDMLYIMRSILDKSGKISVPKFYDDVVRVTPEEEDFYKKIKIDFKEYRRNVGVYRLGHDEQLKLCLMHVWRHPWLNIHYINNSCDDEFNLLNIPKKVFVRFSIRTVPNQTHDKVSKYMINHIHELMEKIKSPNKLEITTEGALDPWVEDYKHWSYQAAEKATKQVYKEDASFIREGNGYPVIHVLKDAMPKRNILIIPPIDNESRVHTERENISKRCYIESSKLFVSYFWELNETSKKYEKLKRAKKLKNHESICR